MHQSFLTLMGLALVIPATMVSPDVLLATPNQSTFQTNPDQKLLTNGFDGLISQQNRPSRNPPPPPSYNGSRDPICVISPGVQEQGKTIWSDHPLFIWKTQQQGAVGRITVWNSNTREILWSQDVEATTQYIMYGGNPLQPGAEYKWVLSSRTGDSTTVDWRRGKRFNIMETERRNPITAELQRIDTELSNNHASVEAIALSQAEYFQDQGLWSDALQVLYTVPNPSATVTQIIEQISSQSCQ